jgi:hypothetical protein
VTVLLIGGGIMLACYAVIRLALAGDRLEEIGGTTRPGGQEDGPW